MLYARLGKIEAARSMLQIAAKLKEPLCFPIDDYYEVAQALEANGYIELGIVKECSTSYPVKDSESFAFNECIGLSRVTEKGYEALKHIGDDEYVETMLKIEK